MQPTKATDQRWGMEDPRDLDLHILFVFWVITLASGSNRANASSMATVQSQEWP